MSAPGPGLRTLDLSGRARCDHSGICASVLHISDALETLRESKVRQRDYRSEQENCMLPDKTPCSTPFIHVRLEALFKALHSRQVAALHIITSYIVNLYF